MNSLEIGQFCWLQGFFLKTWGIQKTGYLSVISGFPRLIKY